MYARNMKNESALGDDNTNQMATKTRKTASQRPSPAC